MKGTRPENKIGFKYDPQYQVILPLSNIKGFIIFDIWVSNKYQIGFGHKKIFIELIGYYSCEKGFKLIT